MSAGSDRGVRVFFWNCRDSDGRGGKREWFEKRYASDRRYRRFHCRSDQRRIGRIGNCIFPVWFVYVLLLLCWSLCWWLCVGKRKRFFKRWKGIYDTGNILYRRRNECGGNADEMGEGYVLWGRIEEGTSGRWKCIRSDGKRGGRGRSRIGRADHTSLYLWRAQPDTRCESIGNAIRFKRNTYKKAD